MLVSLATELQSYASLSLFIFIFLGGGVCHRIPKSEARLDTYLIQELVLNLHCTVLVRAG